MQEKMTQKPGAARRVESHPCVHGKIFLARVVIPPSRNPHSLYAVDESRIFLDGDPQVGYPTILVLTR